jgi:hypothetical protein
MIINMSRAAFFMQCRRKTYDMYHLGLDPHSTPEPLVIGSAYHVAVAYLVAKRDRVGALALAESTYRDRILGERLLPEELVLAEQNIELTKRMVAAQADLYEHDDWTLLQPEVEFCVELPNTIHHCAFVHDILYPALARNIPSHEPCTDTRCYINHRLKGRADGLISWKNMMWIIERKTSGMAQETFWTQWQLASQPTGYIYGCWKGTGLRPHGFILEKTNKPRKNSRDPFHITIEREPFLRSDADLLEFERDISQIATDYERAYIEDAWYKNTASCTSWNRKCYFFDLCKRNQEQIPGEFRERKKDYVDAEYFKLLGLPVPEIKEAVSVEADT